MIIQVIESKENRLKIHTAHGEKHHGRPQESIGINPYVTTLF